MLRMRNISTKITLIILTILVVTSILLGIPAFIFIKDFLIEDVKGKVSELALVEARQISLLIEEEISSGKHSADEFLDFDYRRLTMPECLKKWTGPDMRKKLSWEYLNRLFASEEKKPDGKIDRYYRYETGYSSDAELGRKFRLIQDSFLDIKELGFSVVLDKNGFVPFHHTKNSMLLSGDLDKDILGCRDKRIWDYLGKAIHPDKVAYNVYKRDTGEYYVLAFAPIKIRGKFWGGIVTGYNAEVINNKIFTIFGLTVILILIWAAIIFVSMNFLINKSIKPVRQISSILKNIAEKSDFSQKMHYDSKDEMGEISRNLNLMIDRISRTINWLKNTSAGLWEASEKLGKTSKSLSKEDRSREQMESIEKMSSELKEILSTINNTSALNNEQVGAIMDTFKSINMLKDLSTAVAKNVKETITASDRSINVAKAGESEIKSASGAMQMIVNSSLKISELVGIINDISDEINLLSLNASIEAARAGDAGRGFAVVANEIGKLADKTSAQVKLVHSLSGEIKSNVDKGNLVVENIHISIAMILDNVIQSGKTISEINKVSDLQTHEHDRIQKIMDELRNRSDEIISISSKQKANSEGINRFMEKIIHYTHETETDSQVIAELSSVLAVRSEELNRLIEQFII